MKNLKLINVGIELNSKYFGYEEINKIKKLRENSLLCNMGGLRTGGGLSILLNNHDNNILVELSRDYQTSMFKLQFYNKGNLIMTYPWNGEVSGKFEGSLVDSIGNLFVEEDKEAFIDNIDIVLDDNKLYIGANIELFENIKSKFNKRSKYSLRVFNLDGSEMYFDCNSDYFKALKNYMKNSKYYVVDSCQVKDFHNPLDF